jgi:acyl-CoA synthetase (AMP-forming)/AMP-acid ligase II
MVSHGNLASNLAYGASLGGPDAHGPSVSWLPPTHDMGLIEGILQPIWSGTPAYLMSPAAFLQRPARWLNAISRYRAVRSGGPNFAYELCARKVRATELADLDLSCWTAAFSGAEPVRAETMTRFASSFAPAGFQAAAFRPCYGLAEATLVVSSGRWDGRATGKVSCGRSIDDTTVIVVDPDTRRVVTRDGVGEIWVQGPGVARGYWNNPALSAIAFGATTPDRPGAFLRTGDLGCLVNGQVVVTGRLKDLLIVRGHKHFPQDLEVTAEESSADIRPGSAVAVASSSDADGDGITIVIEPEPRRAADAAACEAAVDAVRQAIAESHGVQLAGVLVVPPGTVPRTTSGKRQRQACRALVLSDALPVIRGWGHIAAIERAS